MQSGDYSIIPAMAAGFISLQGQIAKNADNTLSIPEGMVNIGGNGYGYILQADAAFDPYNSANTDASYSGVILGDDIYIYACQAAGSPYAKLVCSKNATYPTGYDATNSRKIGGFHVGRTRPIANRFDTAYVPTVEIVPNSVWDEGHRPESLTEGMAEIAPGLWASIYLLSVVSGTWPDVRFGSVYGATPVRSAGGYCEADLNKGLRASGYFEPTYDDWKIGAYGAPQGNDGDNTLAWSMTSNTGPCTTGYVEKAVSCQNIVDTSGNLWERLCHNFDQVGTYNWDTSVVNTGQDAAYGRGAVYHSAWRYALAGGNWNEGARCGSACLYLNAGAWSTAGYVGVRGFSRSRRA
ncbi:hypothetical protein [Hydrogenovibrio marinus]|uniref:Major tropism determinant second domain-containing protein n=1 Tax=Hydrogenovibrio marinus TaxID=28885 RepID=A0A066ZMV7_HYDMR|nr:hypothetical protein [Hydrogenovibrio marinus]KDN94842.1 hypothetical protein EI16_00570 [Hydrogenovibrio marinus]BBN59302.1 hypothetical protein HVMH_0896 [Hydrogenovibrio marinus]